MSYKISYMAFVLLCAMTHIQAEDFPTFSIVELSIQSEKIMEAKFLANTNGVYKFCGHELNSNTAYLDTFELEGIDDIYNTTTIPSSGNNIFQQADAILIYIHIEPGNKYTSTFSGIRLLKDNKILTPFQFINPGKFSFYPGHDTITWSTLQERITNVNKRISAIKEIRKIDDPIIRNQMIFNWLTAHQHEFGQTCNINEDCGWGTFEYDVFKWVTEANISADTWKASKLFREILFPGEQEWTGNTGILYDYGGHTFSTYQDIEFLVATSLNDSSLVADRKQALSFLMKACRIVYQDNYPIPPDSILQFQSLKQKEIRDKLLPLLYDKRLRSFAFDVVSVLSNPMDGNPDRIDLEVLPLLKSIYEDEPPSDFKSKLSFFIVHNSTSEEWKQFTGNDFKILMDLYVADIDTVKHKLKIGINYKYGREPIRENPLIIIEDANSRTQYHQEPASAMKLPYQSWNGTQYLEVNISGFPPGQYRVYVTGKIGTNNEGIWKSTPVNFELN